jgi:hypothetical protein
MRDMVPLIPGVWTPMILYPTGRDTCQVLGPAYIDGMMEGEKRYDDRRWNTSPLKKMIIIGISWRFSWNRLGIFV